MRVDDDLAAPQPCVEELDPSKWPYSLSLSSPCLFVFGQSLVLKINGTQFGSLLLFSSSKFDKPGLETHSLFLFAFDYDLVCEIHSSCKYTYMNSCQLASGTSILVLGLVLNDVLLCCKINHY